MARPIAVITSSRADYGLLYWVLHELKQVPAFELQLVVTGSHLAPEFGYTVNEIERDRFEMRAEYQCWSRETLREVLPNQLVWA